LKEKPEIPAKALDKAPDLGHVTSEAAVVQQAKVELAKPEKEKTKEELEAEKVTNAQVKKYWEAREAERRAPRMHQEGLTVEEKILRLFDMSSQFGVRILASLPHLPVVAIRALRLTTDIYSRQSVSRA
jgi:DNA polymerase delta subunit 4